MWRGDNQDLAYPREKKNGERIINQRLIVYRKQLFRNNLGQRVQTCAAATRQNDPFHVTSIGSYNVRYCSSIYKPKPDAVVDILTQGAPPMFVVQIPLHGLVQSSFERLLRSPPELAFDTRWIDRISSIVARSVGDKLDQFSSSLTTGRQFIQQIADSLNNLEIGAFAPPTDKIFLPNIALG